MAVKDNWLVRVKRIEKILAGARKSYESEAITRNVFEGQIRLTIRKLEYLASDVNGGISDFREEW
jgi:hypothetical protein